MSMAYKASVFFVHAVPQQGSGIRALTLTPGRTQDVVGALPVVHIVEHD